MVVGGDRKIIRGRRKANKTKISGKKDTRRRE